jgi:hypothetical protein
MGIKYLVFNIFIITFLVTGCHNEKFEKNYRAAGVGTEKILVSKSNNDFNIEKLNKNNKVIGEDNELGNKNNPLYGKIYRSVTDIQGCKNWKDYGGLVIDVESKNVKFGITLYEDERGNKHFFFVEFVQLNQTTGKTDYRILDTMNAGKMPNNEDAVFGGFMLNNKNDREIFGIISFEYIAYRRKNIVIKKTWRADRNTGKIIPIDNKNINYIEDYS